MRILHLTRDFPPSCSGGLSTAVHGMVRASADAGIETAVISFDAWRPAAAAGVAPPAPPGGDGSAPLRLTHSAHWPRILERAAALHPQILHVHDAMLWPYAEELRQRLGAAAVLSLHVLQRTQNDLRVSGERTLGLAAQEQAVRAAGRIIVASRAAAHRLNLPAAETSRLRIVPLGAHDTARARAAAGSYAKRSGGPFLFVGRFSDIKGTADLFEVIRAVLDRLPHASFDVVGGVPRNRRAELRWLRRWKDSTPASLQQRVRFTGWVDWAAVTEFYSTAAALIVPSRFETFCLAAVEAMLHGLPVIATRAGGLAELIDDGVNGLVADVGDVACLTRHAVALHRDREMAARLGRNAAAKARAELLWPAVLPRLEAVYEEIA